MGSSAMERKLLNDMSTQFDNVTFIYFCLLFHLEASVEEAFCHS